MGLDFSTRLDRLERDVKKLMNIQRPEMYQKVDDSHHFDEKSKFSPTPAYKTKSEVRSMLEKASIERMADSKRLKSLSVLIILSFCLMAFKCDGKCYELDSSGNPVEIPCPVPTVEPSIPPTAPPTIIPTDPPTIEPTSPPSTPPTPDPDPSISPFPINCNLYKPWPTGWSFLSCVDKNNKHICGGSKPDCGLVQPVGSACNGDSTPRYNGEVPCWKTGNVERCEYPPGSKCGETTVWSGSPQVIINPESDGYGARIKFPKVGTFSIKACRKGTNLCTEKQVRIN